MKELDEKTIKRDLIESLIRQHLDGANEMERTIYLAGEHYCYRDKLRMHQWAASQLEREHLYLLLYDESSERLKKLRAEVEAVHRQALFVLREQMENPKSARHTERP